MPGIFRRRKKKKEESREIQPYIHQGEIDLYDEGTETCLECEGTGKELEPKSKKFTGNQCRACHGIGRIPNK